MKLFFSLWIAINLVGLINYLAYAAMPEKDYRAALQLAEKRVLKKNEVQNSSENISASTLKILFGRFYQVGDCWDVASWSFRNSEMRKTDNPQDLKKKLGPGGVFHYEVTRVRPGSRAEVDFKVTQVPSPDFKQLDPRISHLNLTLKLTAQNQIVQAHKTYSFFDSNIGNNSQTSLELFPLDIPETLNADQLPTATQPVLPPEIQDIAHRLGFHPLLSQSTEFQQDDFFGRPVHILWQQGDPWPVYLRTVNGIAILIRKGQL